MSGRKRIFDKSGPVNEEIDVATVVVGLCMGDEGGVGGPQEKRRRTHTLQIKGKLKLYLLSSKFIFQVDLRRCL